MTQKLSKVLKMVDKLIKSEAGFEGQKSYKKNERNAYTKVSINLSLYFNSLLRTLTALQT